MRRVAVAVVAVPVTIGFASFLGAATASAAANPPHADCIGIMASTGNEQGPWVGGGKVASLTQTGVVGQMARTNTCATTPIAF
ncbi:MAG: hypothetical protein ACP5PM_09240 [Acidimicrobiales bacterium]